MEVQLDIYIQKEKGHFLGWFFLYVELTELHEKKINVIYGWFKIELVTPLKEISFPNGVKINSLVS